MKLRTSEVLRSFTCTPTTHVKINQNYFVDLIRNVRSHGISLESFHLYSWFTTMGIQRNAGRSIFRFPRTHVIQLTRELMSVGM